MDPSIPTGDPDLPLGPDTVGAITFVLREQDGEELDRQEEPLLYLHGSGALLPGLEAALEGRRRGERFTADVAPAEGFGEYDEDAVYYVPRSSFPDEAPLEPGSMFSASREDGSSVTFWITQVEDERVVVNENHPLAGVALSFEVEIVGVRPATEEERREGRLSAQD